MYTIYHVVVAPGRGVIQFFYRNVKTSPRRIILITQNIRVITSYIRVIILKIRVITLNIRVITQT